MDICKVKDIYEDLRTLTMNQRNILLSALMRSGDLDFCELVKVYVTYLEDEKKLKDNMKEEAIQCIQGLLDGDMSDDFKQRCMYFLDKAGAIPPADYKPKKGKAVSGFHWGADTEDYKTAFTNTKNK